MWQCDPQMNINICSGQVERESLKRQTEAFQRDASSHGAELSKLRGNVYDLERELTACKGQSEEASHKAQVQLSDLKLDMVRQRGELEKDRDKLANLVDGESIQKHSSTFCFHP